MKKLSYVSSDFFFDVDFPVLKNLSKFYDITWHAVFPINNARFTKEFLTEFCKVNGINLFPHTREFRKKDVRTLIFDFKLIKSILNDKSDLIYIEDIGDVFFSLISMIRLKKEKTIISFHDIIFHKGSDSILFNFISQKILLIKFKNIHLYSRTQKKLIRFNKKKNFLITPLFLKDYGSPTIQKANTTLVRFLFFGRIEYYKGLDVLIKAINLLQKKNIKNFICTIAGSCDNWEKKYQSLIEDTSNINLRIEFIPNVEIANIFAEHHYLILPYKDVTQSGPLFIGFNYGLPAIASNHDGFQEFVIDKKTGFLFENENEFKLAQILEEIILNVDHEKIKINLTEYIEEHLEDRIITKLYLNYFNKLLLNDDHVI